MIFFSSQSLTKAFEEECEQAFKICETLNLNKEIWLEATFLEAFQMR